jgi:transcriptional regulator with XRE-family HTH domain
MVRRNSSTIEQSFGQLLRRQRSAKGISQEELAHLSGLHRTYVSQIERGLKSPSLGTLSALAKALELEISEMVRDLSRSRTESR